jgi:hypothetical protein
MANKQSHRQRARQRKRLLAAAARRAERKGNQADAAWARAQHEMRYGDIEPGPSGLYGPGLYGGDAA